MAGYRGVGGERGESPKEKPTDRKIPNQRELSKDDYVWLGAIVWNQMQVLANSEKKELDEEAIRGLVDQMQRNRNEVVLTLDALYALLSSPSLCAPKARSWGIDLDEPIGPQFDIFNKQKSATL